MAEQLREFDSARYLDTPEKIAAYLNEALADHDPAFLAFALDQAARARTMYGLPGQAASEPASGASAAFDAVRRTFEALGMKVRVVVA